MKKAMEIKSELDKTQSRITELEMERDLQTVAVEATEKAFIDGKADVAKLNDAQGKLSLYERTIESLRATYQRLKSAFENQSEAEDRREQIKKMTDAANSVEPLLNDYLQTRNEFNDVVSKYAETLINQATAYRNKQAEYQSIVRELKPTGAEIQESGLEQKTLTMASATYFNHPPMGTFDEAVALAENLLAAKINKAAQAKRQAEFSARTMERTEKAFAEQAATN
jgi:DNA repair exonuclease SbcCD ATPase subunit